MGSHYLKRKGGQPWSEVPCVYCGQKPGNLSLGSFMEEECPHDHSDKEAIIAAIEGKE